MIYIEAPENAITNNTSLFLAGGIQNCPDHQAFICNELKDTDITIYNPRRKNFPIKNPNAAYEQIKWEFEHLAAATMISFWFCKETECPIVLLELGKYLMTNKPIVIGIDPKYSRARDVEIQTQLERSDTTIVYSLEDLSNEISKMHNDIILKR